MVARSFRYIFTFIIIFLIAAYGFTWYEFIYHPIIPAGQTYDFQMKPGASLTSVANDLYKQGLIKHAHYFVWLAKLQRKATKVKAGYYRFNGPLTARQILTKFLKGETFQYKITFIEGWTFRHMMQTIDNHEGLVHQLKGLSNQQIMAKLGNPEEHPEGRFFPSTYYFTPGTSDKQLLKRAYDTMNKLLYKLWQARAPGLPYKSPYEALIAASLIEKETGVNAEKPIIAGVIVRRLAKGMLLQIDPTVIYGLKDKFAGSITKLHLADKNNPYNTYIYKGLPPSPIAMPSYQSIYATLHPDNGNAIYFVATGNGGHMFSASLPEHQQAVSQYVQTMKQKALQREKLFRIANWVMRAINQGLLSRITKPVAQVSKSIKPCIFTYQEAIVGLFPYKIELLNCQQLITA